MVKVQIITRCEHCNGQAYLPVGEDVSYTGEKYIRHKPCPNCQGSARQTLWIPLDEFVKLLEPVLCKHEHSSCRGRFHLSQGHVWDDIVEVCDDCGAVLD
jgi:hypothetical protein